MNTYTVLYKIEKPGVDALFGREYTVDADSEQEAINQLYRAKEEGYEPNETIYEIEDAMQHDVEEA